MEGDPLIGFSDPHIPTRSFCRFEKFAFIDHLSRQISNTKKSTSAICTPQPPWLGERKRGEGYAYTR